MTANKAGSAANKATPDVKTLERELQERGQKAKEADKASGVAKATLKAAKKEAKRAAKAARQSRREAKQGAEGAEGRDAAAIGGSEEKQIKEALARSGEDDCRCSADATRCPYRWQISQVAAKVSEGACGQAAGGARGTAVAD